MDIISGNVTTTQEISGEARDAKEKKMELGESLILVLRTMITQ